MIRPHLGFGQCLWSPHLKKYINLIKNVQERATSLVNGFQNIIYTERLKKLGLTTLSFRRLRGDLIEMYKHFNRYDKTAMEAPPFVCRTRPFRKEQQDWSMDFIISVILSGFKNWALRHIPS